MINKLETMLFGIVLAILCIVSFSYWQSYYPIGRFHGEVLSLICAVALFAIAISSHTKIRISNIAIACFLFSAFILLQPFMVKINYLGNNFYVALVFFILGLGSMGVSSYIDNDPKKRNLLLTILCWVLLVAATLQAAIAILQFTGNVPNDQIWFMPSAPGITDGSNIYGNLGQPNQFTDFISIGVVALCFLYFIGQINLLTFIIYSILFASVITFTARRGVLLYYAVMMMLMLAVWLINRKNPDQKQSVKKVLMIVAGFFGGLILIQILIPYLLTLSLNNSSAVNTGVGRLAISEIGQSTYRRFYEYYKAWTLFVEHPLFGIGWYQYPHHGIYIMMTEKFMYIPQNMKLYTHSHNSLLNIMAETGIIGTAILVFYGIGYSFYLLLKKLNTPQAWFAVLLTIPVLIHSLLEFPLWYNYFLVLLIIILSFAPSISYKINNNWLAKLIGYGAVVGLSVIAYNAYQVNEKLGLYSHVPIDRDDYAHNVNELRVLIDNNSIFSFNAAQVLDSYIVPGSTITNSVMTFSDQVKYVDQLAYSVPYPQSIFKQIYLHKMAGNDQLANYYADILVHGYPYYQQEFIRQFSGNPAFSDIVQTLQKFHYEDKSTLAKIFSKNRGK